jgi:hypothetical protein
VQTESLGKLLPQVFLPYAQQWAERSGMPFLSKLLVDENLRALIEQYGPELFEHLSKGQQAPPRHNGHANGSLSDMDGRLKAIEAQYELVLGLLETVRVKMRPLAASLGCCPECLVGVAGCHKCLGKSRVAYYEPDPSLLQSEVVSPLAARGVPLSLKEAAARPARRASEPTATRTRSKQWPRK